MFDVEQNGDQLCVFCQRDTKEIRYGEHSELVITQKEVVEEYKLFMQKLREQKNIAEAIDKKSKKETEPTGLPPDDQIIKVL
jgi:wyosine [tRNA(Phe)-imidazoG37] synthetase (radical SAM superfamily)